MTEECYKIYAEKTGIVVYALMASQENDVQGLCDKIKDTGMIPENLKYSKIGVEEYKELREKTTNPPMKLTSKLDTLKN